MSDASDPLLPQVRAHFEALLSNEESTAQALDWSHDQLDQGTWRDEVTYLGLMRLADLVHATWNYVIEQCSPARHVFQG
ncbi:hypothetical protein [Leifsonia aquatica]|uniref:hypothetical protein n=1 Tax=Leifsonia aquatica TaxID=144185 RepID=UPI0013B3D487|nr:hypothetical protein [Leifsonia aquatica]